MKTSWIVVWDLQCPFCRKNWRKLPELQKAFGADYEISIRLTSLAFHRQAFSAHCAASLIDKYQGAKAKLNFINTCYTHQERYTSDSVGDKRPSEIYAIFAELAKEAGVLDDSFTSDVFLAKVQDWEDAVQPAWTEHKKALEYGVFGTPKHVIGGELVLDTESDWGVDEWREKLTTLQANKKARIGE